ncbi:MAG: LamG-like jellyroll fold domain-containing protein, partial [Planctomycetota bacterium]
MNSKHRCQFDNILKFKNKRLFWWLLLTMVCSGCASSTDKTLVSWVKIENSEIRGGSILTIQDGEQFDGIILNQEGRWEAGSDKKKRTESTDAEVRTGKMEQIATVYKGSEICMYRDGELVTKYSAQNIDLLSSNENFVVFGRSHYGGDDFIIAEIEDAR